ncbi:MAG TPA: hypothetical protein VEK79_01155 [Thermoanaerobaculia bacterium]|nr:hypothetical protein [Thermoanaerobaculia bacterium]
MKIRTTILAITASVVLVTACTGQTIAGLAPAVDPGGRSLAYLEYTGQGLGYRIVTRNVGRTGEPRVIEPDVAETQLAWSPDGRRLAYVVENAERQPALRVTNVNAGAAEVVELRVPLAPSPFGVAFVDDAHVLVGAGSALLVADLSNGTAKKIFESTTDLVPRLGSISVSAAGRIAFTCGGTAADDVESICVVENMQRVSPRIVATGSVTTPVWRSHDELLYSRGATVWERDHFAVQRRHLWLLNVTTGRSRQLTSGDVVDSWPSVEPSTGRLAFARIDLSKAKTSMPETGRDPSFVSGLERGFNSVEALLRRSTIVWTEVTARERRRP